MGKGGNERHGIVPSQKKNKLLIKPNNKAFKKREENFIWRLQKLKTEKATEYLCLKHYKFRNISMCRYQSMLVVLRQL